MIDAVRLINIQSFKDITYNLSNAINVFQAPNETGKSVLFKVFRIMCDANWYGRGERKSLIRRGCEYGAAQITLTPKDNVVYQITFGLYPTNQIYILTKDGSTIGEWDQDSMPQEIMKLLGWVYDKDTKILLNLCDQELDMPFVNSNEGFNFDVFRFVIKDAELESARENLARWIKELETCDDKVNASISNYKYAFSDVKFEDVDKLEMQIKVKEKLLEKEKAIGSAAVAFENCMIVQPPTFNTIDEDTLIRHFNNIDLILDTHEKVERLVNLKQPTFNTIDEDEFNEHMEKVNVLSKTINLFKDITALKAPTFNTIDEECLSQSLSTLQILNRLIGVLRGTRKVMYEMNQESTAITHILGLIDRFESENKICPLCGKPFNNESEVCCNG